MLRKKFPAFSFMLFYLVASSHASIPSFVITSDDFIIYPDADSIIQGTANCIQILSPLNQYKQIHFI